MAARSFGLGRRSNSPGKSQLVSRQPQLVSSVDQAMMTSQYFPNEAEGPSLAQAGWLTCLWPLF